MTPQTISDQTWVGIRTEFTLPALAQVHRRLAELMEDPEPLMRELVRVFIDDGTFCPGFQFLPRRAAPATRHSALPTGHGAGHPAQL